MIFKRLFHSPQEPEIITPIKDIASSISEEDEFSCFLEEYRALRAEILLRLENQNQLVGRLA